VEELDLFLDQVLVDMEDKSFSVNTFYWPQLMMVCAAETCFIDPIDNTVFHFIFYTICNGW